MTRYETIIPQCSNVDTIARNRDKETPTSRLLFRARTLHEGILPVTGEFPSQKAHNVEI